MQAGYFSTAWNDIKNTQGWLKKMFLLALIALIPIFGSIVTNGYLYGWARDAAWGVKSPMPQKIFGNEDGKLYSRGFFILVLGFVLALIMGIFYSIYMAITGFGIYSISADGSNYGAFAGLGIVTLLFWLVFIAAGFALTFFQWVGTMRISIYGSLSAGFQFKKIWKMIRKDFGGLLRIFGMYLIVALIFGIIVSIISSVLAFIFIVPIVVATTGDSSSAGLIVGTVFAFFVVFMIFLYFALVCGMWMEALVARALGYWTKQFDVANWRGQDDPMPFELNPTPQTQFYSQPQQPPVQPGQYPPAQQPPVQQAPVQQPYQAPQPVEPAVPVTPQPVEPNPAPSETPQPSSGETKPQ